MTIAQLRYLVEIERTQSITKAAENLYMGQPNLSRSVRELEKELGFSVFKRTQKGMVPTVKGEELLLRAKRVLSHIDAIEAINENNVPQQQVFSLVAPRASYVSHAFTRLAASLDLAHPIHLDYQETNTMAAVEAIDSRHYNLGVIRYPHAQEESFLALLKSKKLHSEEVSCFRYQILLSCAHALAGVGEITLESLSPFIEITHGDPYTPFPAGVTRHESRGKDKQIYVYERGSQFDLLADVPSTYMWVSPVPQELLDRNGLVLRECKGEQPLYKDVLVYRKNYKPTELDRRFMEELTFARREVFG